MPPIAPILLTLAGGYADAFRLTTDANVDGRSGIAGAPEDDMVDVDGIAGLIDAVALDPAMADVIHVSTSCFVRNFPNIATHQRLSQPRHLFPTASAATQTPSLLLSSFDYASSLRSGLIATYGGDGKRSLLFKVSRSVKRRFLV